MVRGSLRGTDFNVWGVNIWERHEFLFTKCQEQGQACHKCCLCIWVGWVLLQITWTSGYFRIHLGNHGLPEDKNHLCLLALDLAHVGSSLLDTPRQGPNQESSQSNSEAHGSSWSIWKAGRVRSMSDLVQEFPGKFWDPRGTTWSWMLLRMSIQFCPSM